LPPIVPALRIGGDAKRSQTSVRSGKRFASAANAASSDAPAPIQSSRPAPVSPSSMHLSASTAPT